MVSWFQCMAHAPWYMGITQERHVCDYMFLHKKWSSLNGLSSLSFCRWGSVTPCIIKYHTCICCNKYYYSFLNIRTVHNSIAILFHVLAMYSGSCGFICQLSFFMKEHVLANMSFLSYVYVSRCVRHALESTDHRLMYTDDIMICAISPHSVIAIRSAWFNAPWFFLWGNNSSGLDEEDLLFGRVGQSLLRRYQTCNEAQGRLFEQVL